MKINLEKEFEQVTELQKMFIIKNCPYCETKIKYNIPNIGIYTEELKHNIESVYTDCQVTDFNDTCKCCGKTFTLAIVSPSLKITNKIFSNLIPLEEGKTLEECINNPKRCTLNEIRR